VVDARVVNDVVLVHHIRAMGLVQPGEELHACGALQDLGHVIDPRAAAPATRADIADAIAQGAATDLDTALLRAMQGHDSAVRAASRRAASRGLADTYVHAFRRLVDLAGPEVPNLATRPLDLAAAMGARYMFDESPGMPDDLNGAIELAATPCPWHRTTAASSGGRTSSSALCWSPAATCARSPTTLRPPSPRSASSLR
jgi:hypothetical protein